MKFTPQLLDEIRARLPVSQVVGRKVALKRQGREFAGLSPFKIEKTPSFFVNDQKGFFHCFSSGEHGDIFAFLMKTDGLTFPEAVEKLAQEAGVVIPKAERAAEQRPEGFTRLLFLMEAAAKFFEESLAARSGAPGASYAEKRGLSSTTIAEFRIGYAPNSRSALKEHLAKKGFSLKEMIAAGVLIAGDDIPVPYDRFRHRLMFPIQDTKGRVIAFGGRALDADQTPKYLNSPETTLFHKGRVLYNAHRARQPAYEKRRLLVVEGYMDVVALAQGGFPESVAPLGTALTEDQCRHLWRITGVPTLLFDGDAAGKKAAHRAVDTALPLVASGMSLAFASLADGLDPDEAVRKHGPEALEAAIARSKPLIDVLFEREWALDQWSTPEKRAQLEGAFKKLTARIQDRIVREHYEQDIGARLAASWPRAKTKPFARPQGKPRQASSNIAPPPWPHRETVLIAQLLRHPWLAEARAEEVSEMPLWSPALADLRDAILSAVTAEPDITSAALCNRLRSSHGDALGVLQDKIADARDFERMVVELDWMAELSFHLKSTDLKREIRDAQRDWATSGSDDAFQRIKTAKESLDALRLTERKV